MSKELESLLDYLEQGYVLVSAEGVNGPLADKVRGEYDTVLIIPSKIRAEARKTRPNQAHLDKN